MGVVALVVSRNQEIQIRSQKDVPVHARAKGARATAVFGTKKNEVHVLPKGVFLMGVPLSYPSNWGLFQCLGTRMLLSRGARATLWQLT